MDGTTRDSLRVHRTSKSLRRFFLWYLGFLVVYAITAVVWAGTWQRMTATALLLGMAPMSLQHQTYVEVGREGMAVDRPFRRRSVAWREIETIRMRWPATTRRPELPGIELKDGRVVRSGALAGLGAYERRAERAALLDRLRQEADRHGFALEVQLPDRAASS